MEDLKARIKAAALSHDYTTVHQLGKESRDFKNLGRKLRQLSQIEGEWVAERRGQSMLWSPVWPDHYGERFLFRGVEKVILMSATARPKTAALLGIKPEEFEFIEYPSSFPAKRRPVIHVPTLRMNHRNTDEDLDLWMTRIDQIIGPRLGRKGIIHTVSYKRRDLIMKQSQYSRYMLTHTTGTTRAIVEQFKEMDAPAILVSPSVDTGFDFPLRECDWILISKLPWPDTRSAVMKARTKADPDYMPYLTMQSLVQMAGRGMRSELDACEVVCVDDNIKWVLKSYRSFAPQWFLDSVRFDSTIPVPLEIT